MIDSDKTNKIDEILKILNGQSLFSGIANLTGAFVNILQQALLQEAITKEEALNLAKYVYDKADTLLYVKH